MEAAVAADSTAAVEGIAAEDLAAADIAGAMEATGEGERPRIAGDTADIGEGMRTAGERRMDMREAERRTGSGGASTGRGVLRLRETVA